MTRWALAMLWVLLLGTACDSATKTATTKSAGEAPEGGADASREAAGGSKAPGAAEAASPRGAEPTPGAEPTSGAKPTPGAEPTASAEPTPGAEPTPARLDEAAKLPVSAGSPGCTGFSFDLGEVKDEATTPLGADNPVGESSFARALTLRFSCGGSAQTLALGTVEFDCEGAACGCGYALDGRGGVTPRRPDECEIDTTLEDFEPLRATAPGGTLASWGVLTAVGRGVIHELARYRVRTVEGGFEVVREVFSGGDPGRPEVVARHR